MHYCLVKINNKGLNRTFLIYSWNLTLELTDYEYPGFIIPINLIILEKY